MGFWAGILIGIFVGEIMGLFTCALLTTGHDEDLKRELAHLKSIKRENQ